MRRQALTLLGEQAAGQRGVNTVLPRLPSARGHRSRAFSALFCLFVEGEAPPAEIGSGEDVERALGILPRARHDRADGVGPWHDGATPLDYMAQVASLPALRAAAQVASEDDLRYARRAIGPLTRGLAFVSRLAAGLYHDKFAGFTLLRQLRPGAYTEPTLVALIVSLRHSPSAENLDSLVEAVERTMSDVRQRLGQLYAMPGWLLNDRLAKGVPQHVVRLRQVMQQFKPVPPAQQAR